MRLLLVSAAAMVLGCSSIGGGGSSGPGFEVTGCDLSFKSTNSGGKLLGEQCTENSECAYNECMKVGQFGNYVNTQFGFCTRGCDCENDKSSQLSAEEKQSYVCVYPTSDSTHSSNQAAQHHHVVLVCSNDADCEAMGWTTCRNLTTGGLAKVCHAE